MTNIGRRLLDIAISSIALVVLLPLIVVIAVAVKMGSKGPVLFVDERVGKNGKPFKMIKFRTMILNAANMGLGRIVAEDDWRITPVGHLLRRWTLDEIPQLFNVLKGEMSIIGPRPATRMRSI